MRHELDKSFIRRKPVIFGKRTAQAGFGRIFLPRGLYDEVMSAIPDPRAIALVRHEQTHIHRAKQQGTWKWHARYLLSPRFRFNEELAAYEAQLRYLHNQHIKPNVAEIAKKLSGKLYLWPVSYQQALQELNRFNQYNE